MNNSIYKHNGLYYSDTDLTKELGELYGGKTVELYAEMLENGECGIETRYYLTDEKDLPFNNPDEIVAYRFYDNEVFLEDILPKRKQRRIHNISVRLTEEEYQELLEKVKETDSFTISTYIKWLLKKGL